MDDNEANVLNEITRNNGALWTVLALLVMPREGKFGRTKTVIGALGGGSGIALILRHFGIL